MNEALYRDLIQGGMDPAAARQIASKHVAGTLDTDVLFKSLDEIRGMKPGASVAAETSTTPSLTEEALSKAMADFDTQAAQMQAASDAIVDHVLNATEDRRLAQTAILERQDVLAKGMTDMGEALKKSLDQQNIIFGLLETLTGQPARQPKAVTGDRVPVPSPSDAGDPLKKGGSNAEVTVSGQEVLSKALSEMETLANGENSLQASNRLQELHQAVSALESHQSPALVAQRYKISVK